MGELILYIPQTLKCRKQNKRQNTHRVTLQGIDATSLSLSVPLLLWNISLSVTWRTNWKEFWRKWSWPNWGTIPASVLLLICFRPFNFIVYLKFTSQDTILPSPPFLPPRSKSSIKFRGDTHKVGVAVPPADVGCTVLLEHLNERYQPPPNSL